MILKSRKIVLAITGGIAAYKTVDLVSQLKKLGADVFVVCTENAFKFVSELSLETISGHKVSYKQFPNDDSEIEHINLADKADLILVAPATANTIGKMANGISDSLVTDICLATKAPIVIAPAMNTNMWEHASVKKNLETLKSFGYNFVNPDYGQLACGHVGEGRLADFGKIIDKVCLVLGAGSFEAKKALSGKKVLITAGGTREAIDPVRFIGNRSSGKMGFALADAAHASGAEVVMVSTVNMEKPYKVIHLETAIEMKNAVEKEFSDSDILFMAAAVADFRPSEELDQKIKKGSESELSVRLERNPDILEEVSKHKSSKQIIIGFALESENLLENAKVKLKNKNLDFIIANDINSFDGDESLVHIISKDNQVKSLPKQSKKQISEHLISLLLEDQRVHP